MKTRRMLTIPRLRSVWRAILVVALELLVWPAQLGEATPMNTAFIQNSNSSKCE